MIIVLSDATEPTLTDLDRFDRLHAECSGPVAAARLGELCRLGDADDRGAHVWLDAAAARTAGSAASGDPSFGERFDAMIGFAAKQGWLDAAGTHVRAHVEAV